MRTILHAGLVAAVCCFALLSGAAGAQDRCPEGRTMSGECVNPGLAQSMRQTAIIFSQPKLSYTAYPVLPADDWYYRYPNQLIPDPLQPTIRRGAH